MTASPARSGGAGIAGGHVLGLHHVGIPVRNIERSLAWYGDLFGLSAEFIASAEGPDTSRIVQLDDARLRFAFLTLGATKLELLEYESPTGRDFDRRNCDVGAIHVSFEVDDIEVAHRLLSRRGVDFSSGPMRLTGPISGHSCCYFRDPDGIQFELWQRRPAEGISVE